jgi:anti-sigma regulatory factor (Ser/Thr protein kinase)
MAQSRSAVLATSAQSQRPVADRTPETWAVRDPVEVELPRDASAAGQARRLVGDRVAAELGSEELDRARLLVSELVTNAVLHGLGAITLRARLDADRLLVEVSDEGSGFERAIRQNDLEQLGGWGLSIVDAEASRWGVHEGTTHVWFEIERSGPRIGTEKAPLTDD